MESSRYCLSPSRQVPLLHRGNPTGNYVFFGAQENQIVTADGYTNNNHPISTLSDAAQHLAGKCVFCSQAYHCLQMAAQRSVEMIAFNFASGNFAYKRLAQALSRSVSVFSIL